VFAVAPEAQLEKAKPLAEHAPQLWHVALPCAPDVLLLPSRLGRPCVRVAGATVVVNPGALARNKAYALGLGSRGSG
jgi:hypothetical protein